MGFLLKEKELGVPSSFFALINHRKA